MTVALYARISTRDGRQNVDNQIREMTRFAMARGWIVAEIAAGRRAHYVDERSGSKGESGRDALAELMRDAHARKFDAVLVFALDRFTREGVWEAFSYIQRLKSAGVQFISVTEEHFSTAGPAGELFLAIAAWIAQQERIRLQERIKAGLERTRAAGTVLGRRRCVFDRQKAQDMRGAGMSLRVVAHALGISISVLARGLKR